MARPLSRPMTAARRSYRPTRCAFRSGVRWSSSSASADVIHTFWVPALGGKLDMIPGRENRLMLEAERPGIYRGQCAEYCGEQHALMAFLRGRAGAGGFRRAGSPRTPSRRAEPAERMPKRAARRSSRASAAAPATRSPAPKPRASIGPDLTHVGGRLTLAAGTLPNNPRNLAEWIAASQAIKPGNLMPSYSDAGARGAARARGLSGEPASDAPERRCRGRRASWRSWSASGSRRAAGAFSPPSTTPISASSTSARRFLFFVLAGILALLMRTQLAVPENDLVGARHLQPALHHARHGDDVPLRRAGGGGDGGLSAAQHAGGARPALPAPLGLRVLGLFRRRPGLLLQPLLRRSRRTAAGSCIRR